MLDTAQSSVIIWQTFKHGGGEEESQNHHEKRIRQIEIHSGSSVLIYRETVMKRKEEGEG